MTKYYNSKITQIKSQIFENEKFRDQAEISTFPIKFFPV